MKSLQKWFSLTRPSQQLKTGAVVIGALASGKVNSLEAIANLLLLTLLWVSLSSCVYILNDISDLEKDKLHPKKSRRPLASGQVSINFARNTLAIFLIMNISLFPYLGSGVSICALIYFILNIAYSFKLKNFVVIDLLIVCAGFVLRGLSGVLIVNAEPSLWFILLSLFGSLLLVSGKRSAQRIESENLNSSHRVTISRYPLTFLRQIQTISSSGLIISYVMMTQEKANLENLQKLILELTIVPFMSTILYINYYQDIQNEEEVTNLLVSKKPILYSSIIWFILFTMSILEVGF
ncbi:UbiA 4-hydroxybenzoate polyprenyltransferase and related prenyltransferases [Candidatus Nanopelagicaceae bacterium]